MKSLEKDERSAKQPSDLGEKTRKMPSFLAWPPGLGSTLGTFAMIAFGHGKQVVSTNNHSQVHTAHYHPDSYRHIDVAKRKP